MVHHYLAPLPLCPWDSLGPSEPPQSRRGENAVEEIQFDHLLPFLLAGQGKVDHFIHTVVNGPVKLVRLIAGNDQHESVVVRDGGRGGDDEEKVEKWEGGGLR